MRRSRAVSGRLAFFCVRFRFCFAPFPGGWRVVWFAVSLFLRALVLRRGWRVDWRAFSFFGVCFAGFPGRFWAVGGLIDVRFLRRSLAVDGLFYVRVRVSRD